MSPARLRLYRWVLRAYPSAFRREYGTEMERLVRDRQSHDPTARWIVLREVIDAARTAPRMRWETAMNRAVIIAIATTVAIAALLAGSVMAIIPIAATALVVWLLWGRSLPPIAPLRASRRWFWWLLAGGVSIATAMAIPQIDGGELNSLWWTVMTITLIGGIVSASIGIVLAVSDRGRRLGANRVT